MGLFDSLTGQPEIDGTAAVAAALRAPVVLVVDVAAMGHSLAALVHGFRMFDEMVHLGGVILNRVASPRHEQMLRTALDDIGMPVLGALRRGDLPVGAAPRAHGPVPVAHRSVEAARAVRRLGEAVASGLDMDRLLALAGYGAGAPGPALVPGRGSRRPVSRGVRWSRWPVGRSRRTPTSRTPNCSRRPARTWRSWTRCGTRRCRPAPGPWSIGAGLPEGYAEELSANRRLCTAVAQFARDGWPVVAEGVGLSWLGRDYDGRPMCAVLDASAVTGEQTVAGYREATAAVASPLAPAGTRITGFWRTGPRSRRGPERRRPGPGPAAGRRASSGVRCTRRSWACTGPARRRSPAAWWRPPRWVSERRRVQR